MGQNSKSLKIGVIAVDFYPKIGGMENYAAQLVENFSKVGHDVHLFIKKDDHGVDGVTTYKILTKDLYQDLPRLQEHDMDVWLAVNSSYALLARYKDNVFICAHGNDFLAPWVLYEFKWLQKRFIWRFKKAVEKTCFRLILKKHIGRVAGVFPNSEYTKNRFVKLFPALKNKVEIINPGVDPNFFMEHKDLNNGKFNLISVARLTNKRKNIENIILALDELKDDYQFDYKVIGDGPQKIFLEQLVADKKIGEHVSLKGRVSYEELRDSYQTADLFILTPWTSSKDIEGFGMVYLEANACGVPVLGSRGNGSSSAVNEGVSGFFVDEPSIEQCKKALKNFFDGQIQFDPVKVIAHAEPFRWSNIAQKFLAVMESKRNA